MVNLRREFEGFCLRPFVRMPTIIYDCEIFRAVVLKVEVGQSFMQSNLPAVGRYLKVLRFEFEAFFKQLPQIVHLTAMREQEFFM